MQVSEAVGGSGAVGDNPIAVAALSRTRRAKRSNGCHRVGFSPPLSRQSDCPRLASPVRKAESRGDQTLAIGWASAHRPPNSWTEAQLIGRPHGWAKAHP